MQSQRPRPAIRAILRSGLLGLALTWSTPAGAQVPAPFGLVSWWQGEGNALDAQGVNHAAASGGVTYIEGKVGQAFNLDGTGYLRIASDASLEPGQISIGGWIRPVFSGRPSRGSDTETIIERIDSNLRGYGLFVAMDPSGGFYQQPSGGVPLGTPAFFLNVNGVAHQMFSPVPLPNDGMHHHVAATYDGLTMRLYIDGIEVAQRAAVGSILNAVNVDGFIGTESAFGNRHSQAALDEIFLYDRPLSPAELKAWLTVTVTVDIKPGSFPNSINLGAAGVIPVAVLSTSTLDAVAEVDPATLVLAGASVRVHGRGARWQCDAADVNADDRPDLVCHFTNDLEATEGDSIAVLEGKTYSGRTIRGEDTIRIVP